VFIPKSDGNSVRPLGLRDAWYRLFTRIVARKEAKPFGDRIKNSQLAVGVRGGCEIGAHIAQLQTRVEVTPDDIIAGDDFVVACEDGRNCFNEIAVGPVLEEMRVELPHLCRGFCWFYGASSELIGYDGEVIGSREIGTAQGCPLSTIICALAYLPVHRRLSAIMDEEEAAHPLEHGDPDTHALLADRGKSGVIMYADDTRISGRRRVVAATIRRAQVEAFDPAGITLVGHKGVVYVTDTAAVPEGQFSGRQLTSIGLKTLGNYVGKDEYRKASGLQTLADMKPDYQALMKLPARLAYQLLHYCYDSRPGFLARLMGPELLHEGLEAFDASVDECLRHIIQCPDGGQDLLQRLRGLSPAWGGLGLHRHAGVNAEKAILLSRAMTRKYVEEHLPQLVVTLEREDVWSPVHFAGKVIPVVDITEEESWELGSGVELSIRKAASAIVARIEGNVVHCIRTEFFGQNDPAGVSKQALLRSRLGWKSKGAWWLSRVGNEGGEAYFPSAHFTAMMRHIVFAPFLDSAGTAVTQCHCCQEDARHVVPIAGLYSHAMSCPKAGNFTWRHNSLRDALFAVLKNGLPLGSIVRREESFPRQDGAGEAFRADIYVEARGLVRFIDVAVVDPGNDTYTAAGSAITPLAAAAHREDDKRRRFENRMPGTDGACFIPFVVETSGRMGRQAEDFLHSLQLPKEAIRRLQRLIPLLLARHGGRSLTALRTRGWKGVRQ
jgi:hypothetical protein